MTERTYVVHLKHLQLPDRVCWFRLIATSYDQAAVFALNTVMHPDDWEVEYVRQTRGG